MSPTIGPLSVRRFGVALAVAPLLLLSACTHEQPKAAVPTVATVAAPIPAPVAVSPAPDTSFKVSEVVRVKCSLPDTPTDSPQFDFDQTDLRPRGMGILDAWQLDRRVAIDERSAIAAK